MRYLKASKANSILLAILLLPSIVFATDDGRPKGECTVGVFGATVTSDGRPILWKNRDVGNHNQRFIYVQSYQRDGITTMPYIGNVYSQDSTRIYMGANAAGFAIMNSDSYNLDDTLTAGIDDGTLMRIALETCANQADFEGLLDSTNVTARKDCWNFGVIDSSSGCAMYECANQSYHKYIPEANEPLGRGYIIRANFSLTGNAQQTGLDRYKRAIDLTENRLAGGSIDERFVLDKLMRDLGNIYDDPYPLPYFRCQAGGPAGYIFNYGGTISNSSTSSAIVIKGILPGEDPLMTTIYAVLGSPDLSLAYPLWVGAETVPIYLSRPDSTPMYIYCMSRRSRLYDNPDAMFYLNSKKLYDEFGDGFYSFTIPLESWGIETAESFLEDWRYSLPPAYEMASGQFYIASAIFAGFQQENATYVTGIEGTPVEIPNGLSLYNYPNPFNGWTVIAYDLPEIEPDIKLDIYDSLGRLVKSFAGTGFAKNSVIWDGEDSAGNRVKSGIYFYRLKAKDFSLNKKMILLK